MNKREAREMRRRSFSELDRARTDWMDCECTECMSASNAENRKCKLWLALLDTEERLR